MKILFVLECANLMTNGTTATCLRFAKELQKLGHEVRLVGGAYKNPEETPKGYVALANFHFPFFQWILEREGFSFVKVEDDKLYEAVAWADLVHTFLPFRLSNHARLLALSMGKPVTGAFHLMPENITNIFGIGWCKALDKAIYKGFHSYFYQHISYIHAPTEMTARSMKEHGYGGHNIVVISNGVNTTFFHKEAPKRPKELEGKFIITSVGRLSKEKRQDVIIRAVAESKYNKDIQLILCGQGPEKESYEKLAKKYHLANPLIVKFCSQDELRTILNYSDLYVHCADVEIEGISCLEAIACGTVPVIGDAPLSATKDFALDGRCLFRHGDHKALKERIEFLIDNPHEFKDLREIYARQGEVHSIDNVVSEMNAMLLKAKKDYEEAMEAGEAASISKKDKRELRRIYAGLQKKGIVSEIPSSFR